MNVKDTKFDELLEFPCKQTFKVMGLAQDDLPHKVIEVIRSLASEEHKHHDYVPSIKPSAKGNYHSVSLSVTVTSKEHMELIYNEVGKIDIVRVVL